MAGRAHQQLARPSGQATLAVGVSRLLETARTRAAEAGRVLNGGGCKRRDGAKGGISLKARSFFFLLFLGRAVQRISSYLEKKRDRQIDEKERTFF